MELCAAGTRDFDKIGGVCRVRAFPAACAGATLAALALAAPAPAQAQALRALSVSAIYTADTVGAVTGVTPKAGRYLDNLDMTADVDLGAAVGWQGATLHAHVLSNQGGAPNALAGTLQGIDNIEVSDTRVRLFQLWVQQDLGPASVRAGLYDLNSEFYASEAAGLLIHPSFGIGSELAATGPKGPSIFPSTALSVRVNLALGGRGYARAAVLNATSGVPGDRGGVDLDFDEGLLAIAEAGLEGPTRLGVGAWRYSQRQDHIRALDRAGAPVRRRAQGVYLLGERRLFGRNAGPEGTAFLRIGLSDGQTTPFRGGWQAGVLVARPFAARPHGLLAIGVQQGVLSGPFRANLRDGGPRPARAETGAEVTYSDRISRRITVQPDLQWVRHAGGDRDARDRLIATLRVQVDLSPTVRK